VPQSANQSPTATNGRCNRMHAHAGKLVVIHWFDFLAVDILKLKEGIKTW
jgi:hypothetical protein